MRVSSSVTATCCVPPTPAAPPMPARRLDEKLDLAGYAHDELAADPHLTVLRRPELSTAVFCHGRDTPGLLRRVNAEQRVYLSSTRVGGRHVGRIRVLNHRTGRARVAMAVDAIRRHAAAIG
jgi:hypothetical protein